MAERREVTILAKRSIGDDESEVTVEVKLRGKRTIDTNDDAVGITRQVLTRLIDKAGDDVAGS